MYVIASDEIGFVGKDRVLDFDTDPKEPLCDELQCPVADEVLVALRKSFTLSYPKNPFIDGLRAALDEIRRICVEALIDMPDVLQDLKLAPIPPAADMEVNRVKVFKFFLVRSSDLRVTVTYEGRKRSLHNIIETDPADELIRTARSAVSLTFSEMYNEEQHEAALLQIRNAIWDVLPAYNGYLAAIDVEPIAEKQAEDSGE